jgi:tetratricopeptide (TPR) repeat protein
MGGVGKTELAIQYALSKEFQQCYVACYWFSLNEGNLASLVLQKAAPYLAMPEEIQKSDDVYEQVKWCWQNWHPPEGEVLVILDDVKNLDDIPKKAMPISVRFKVMLTTRQKNLSPSFQELLLGVLPEDEALELLKRIVDKDGSSRIEDEIDTAKEICAYLGYLPLALELASIYLAENETLKLIKYLEQLNLKDKSLSDEMVKWITAERGVIAAFQLSWEILSTTSMNVAMIMGLFAPVEIWWLLVEAVGEEADLSEEELREAQIQLSKMHFIQCGSSDQKSYSIHSLIREFFLIQIEKAESQAESISRHIKQAMQAIMEESSIYADPYLSTLFEVNSIIDDYCLSKINNGKLLRESFVKILSNWASQTIMTHQKLGETAPKELREMTSFLVAHIEHIVINMYDEIPEIESNLIHIHMYEFISRFYEWNQQFVSTKKWRSECYTKAVEKFGNLSLTSAASLSNLAKSNITLGNLREAEMNLKNSIEIIRQIGGEDIFLATPLNNLAIVYREQGNYEQAELTYKQVIDIDKAIYGEDHTETITDLGNLAVVFIAAQRRYEEAESILKKVIGHFTNEYGVNHPTVINHQGNLSELYRLQGKHENAESVAQANFISTGEMYAKDTIAYADSLNDLGLAYGSNGKHEEARNYFKEALEIYKNLLGNRHHSVARVLNNQGESYRMLGNNDLAKPLLEEALEIRKENFGDSHPDIANSLHNLAMLEFDIGNDKEAESYFRQSVEVMRACFDVGHPTLAKELNLLAQSCMVQKNYIESSIIYQELLQLHPKISDEYQVELLYDLAVSYYYQSKYEETESIFEELLQKQHFIADLPSFFARFAQLFLDQKKYDKAEPLLRKALQLQRESLGNQHPDVDTSIANLAFVCIEAGKLDEAKTLYLEELEILRAKVGEEHPETAKLKLQLIMLEMQILSGLDVESLNKMMADDKESSAKLLLNAINNQDDVLSQNEDILSKENQNIQAISSNEQALIDQQKPALWKSIFLLLQLPFILAFALIYWLTESGFIVPFVLILWLISYLNQSDAPK